MKTNRIIFIAAFFFAAFAANAQQRGNIITPASPAANPMNPNGDNWVTKQNGLFTLNGNPAGYYVNEFETKMFGLPKVGAGDIAGDNQTGPNCGMSDLIPDIYGYSAYAALVPFAYPSQSSINNLVFRFRLGDNASSVNSWSVLIDTDNRFGLGIDPNATAANPGFELEVTLINKTNPGVYVTYVDGQSSCPTPYKSYPLGSNLQIAVGDTQSCNDPDYFYDFFVTVPDLLAAYNASNPSAQITSASGFRYVAATSQTSTCFFGGSNSDIGGVDDDVAPYAGNKIAALTAVVTNQCPTAIESLCSTCDGFETGYSWKPTINPVAVGDTQVSGTTLAATYVKLSVYSLVSPGVYSTTPKFQQTVYSSNGTWLVTLASALQNNDKIVAQSQTTIDGSAVCDQYSSNSSTSTTIVNNFRPVATPQTLSTPEDTPLNITLSATDGNPGDVLTYTFTQPAHGTVTGSGANVIYTPTANYFGPDSFTFKASDSKAESLPATISITVTAVNDVPVASNQTLSTNEDTSVGITLVATDVETAAASLIYASTTPANGTLSCNNCRTPTYTPNLNFNGTDTFTFTASDGSAISNVATVTITVTAVNDAPVANNQSVTVVEDTPKSFTLVGTDVEGNSLTYTVVTQPLNGTLSVSGSSVTYTPNTNYFGPDSFTFKVNDGSVDSNIATVSITVTPVNDAPVAANQSVTTPEDTALPITLTATDVDGNPITYTIVTPPQHGTLSAVSGAGVTYTPALNYNGSDSFVFQASDNGTPVLSSNGTILIEVTAVNDAPIANSQTVNTNEDVSVSITLTGSDVDGDALTYSVVSGPTNGSLSGTAPNLTYTPNANYNGSDSFTFKVNDGTVDSNIATVTINIAAVNDAPVASDQSVTTPEDVAKAITLVATDVDTGTTLTYTIVAGPLHGTLSGTAPNVTYTPNANYNGPDSFTFRASDGTLTSNTATVSITVTAVNDAPIANSQTVNTNEDVSVSITLTGSDVDGDALTYSVVSGPTNGSLSGTAPNLTYTPNANYNGSDSFTFKVNDGTVDSNIATVTINIAAVNDAPVASDQSVTTPEDIAKAITLVATDVDTGTTLTYTIVAGPLHGTLSGTAPNVTYTPNANYNGPDSFTFRASDGTLTSNTATVSITVTAVNDAPIANSQSVSVNEDASVLITLTGSDIDNDPLTYIIVTNPIHGTLTGTGANLTYTPVANYSGADSFTFKVNDGTADSNTATVTITVNPINDAPVALDKTVLYQQNLPVSFTIQAIDADPTDILTFTVLTQPLNGTLSGTAPNLTFTPALNFAGSTSFTFRVNDGTVNSNIATVTLNLDDGTNYPPIAFDQTLSVNEDNNLNIVLVATDANGNSLTYIIVSGPTHGTITTGTGNTRVYTPALNYNGTDTFTFKANDGTSDSNTATVTITVNPVNDAPIADAQTVIVTEDVAKAITLTGSDVEGSNLTYTVISAPTKGTLSGTGANLTYTPSLNYNGSDNFTFKVNDGSLDSSPATVSITVNAVNDAPVAIAQTLTTSEDTPLPIVLSGTDVEGDALTYSVTTLPVHGTLSCTNCANPTYTPDPNYNGSDSFVFKVNDSQLDSAPATISITVTPVNDAPIANAQSVTVTEDIAKAIVLTGSDVENSILTYTILTLPTRGVLSGSGANITYTPNANYNGSDSFTFKVNDGTVDSNTATVSITVTPVNDAPIASAQTLTTAEEAPLPIVLVGTDIDGDALTYSVTTLPSHGTLSCTNCATPTYTPDLNYNGVDSFVFTVNDGQVDSAPATVTITVTPVNDVPIANAQSVTVTEDIAKAIVLTGSDVEGSTLTFTVVTAPTRGSLSGSGANLTYTPNLNFNGSDSFTFKVNDGTVDSNIATVSITVTPVNDVPVAVNDNATTNEDNAVSFSITQNDTDVDGVIVSATADLDPSTSVEDKTLTTAEGVFVVNNLGVVTFTPVLNFNGTSTITYTVKDNDGDLSNTAQIVVTVVPVNDAPVVTAKTVDVLEDVPTSICFQFTDIENDPAIFSTPDAVSFGGNGSVVIDPLTGAFCFTYSPNPDYNGPDEVRVTVCDALNPTLCNTGVITINVIPVNDAPRVIVDGISVTKINYTTLEDTPLAKCFTAIDPDGDTFSTSNLANVVGGGALNLTAGATNELCFNFTPTLNANGMSTWSFNVCDSATPSLCSTITLDIDVTPVNDTPIANNQTVTTVEETPLAITLSGSDVDADPLTYIIYEAPLHGVLSGTGANITYTPDLDYSGPDHFTFKINDGSIDSDVATIDITVTPVNDSPIIVPVPAYTTPEDTSIKICISTTDPDGDVLTFSSPVNQAGGGTMTIDPSGTCFVFAPAKDFNGVSTWKFKVCDTGNPALCSETTVTITVTPVNDAPVAVNDYITVKGPVINDPFNLLDNDYDVDNDPLTMTIIAVAGPFHGSIVTMNSDGKFEYVANQGFVGSDSVRYRVCDNANPSLCDEGVVFIEVEYPPFKFYNAVSPNGDGLNDYWRIDSIEAYPNNHVNIFDRYNNLIFEMSGYDNDQKSWTGQINHGLIKGTATDGTYYYVMDLGDGSALQSGYIVLRKDQ